MTESEYKTAHPVAWPTFKVAVMVMPISLGLAATSDTNALARGLALLGGACLVITSISLAVLNR